MDVLKEQEMEDLKVQVESYETELNRLNQVLHCSKGCRLLEVIEEFQLSTFIILIILSKLTWGTIHGHIGHEHVVLKYPWSQFQTIKLVVNVIRDVQDLVMLILRESNSFRHIELQ